MFVITHLLAYFISIKPYNTYNRNPRFSPSPINVSMTESNLVMFNNTSKASYYLKSSFHSLRLNTKGSTNRTNYFSRSAHELKWINVERHNLVIFQLFRTLFISANSSLPTNIFFPYQDFVYCRMAFNEPYLTQILGYFKRLMSSLTNSGVMISTY